MLDRPSAIEPSYFLARKGEKGMLGRVFQHPASSQPPGQAGFRIAHRMGRREGIAVRHHRDDGLGVAYLSGTRVGFRQDPNELAKLWTPARPLEPNWAEEARNPLFKHWRRAPNVPGSGRLYLITASCFDNLWT